MLKVDVINMTGNKVGEVELDESIFGIEPNVPVMHEVTTAYLANQRQGTQNALTRAEVSGGGIKPWRQKGTGRARQGSTRAPQWRHGGIVFAPKSRDYRMSVNKKVKRLAMKSALSSKVAEGELVVFDELNIADGKTKTMAKVLNSAKLENALVVLVNKEEENRDAVEKVERATRNIAGVKTTSVGTLNVYEILKYGKLVLTKDSLEKVQEVYR